MNCRFCKQSLTSNFAELHHSPPSNSFLSKAQLDEPETYYPLKLYVCDSCFLVQVAEYKKADEIFNNEYVYFSSFSTSWLAHAKKYRDLMLEKYKPGKDSLVAEIASNDGYLLQYFHEMNIPVLGIEPTKNTAEAAIKKGIPSITEFFGIALAERLSRAGKKADLLIGNNVLAHVPDINDFVGGLRIMLKDEGVITMEFPHLLRLVNMCQFDTIYHEHFSYLGFITVKKIFEHHGLTIFDVEELPTHGGSLRIYAKHAADNSKKTETRVSAMMRMEEEAGMKGAEFYSGFQPRMEEVKNKLLDFLISAKAGGHKVAAYGAAAKGNTLLNFSGIREDLIMFVSDASPYKQGKYLPGSHIPVLHENAIREQKPDFILILPWNIKDEIVQQLAYIRNWNGRFVTAVPHLEIL